MGEQLDSIPKTEIKWPQGNKVEVGHDVDFVYIMRKDGKFAMSSIAQKMAADYQLDEQTLSQTLLEEYDTFFTKLADTFKWGFTPKGNFELHLFNPDNLDKEIRLKSGALSIVSLDPLMNEGVYEHRVSRAYYLGGKEEFGQVARPGNKALSIQTEEINKNLNGLPASVSEDDIFSGGSVIASLKELLSQGINIQKVIPGIQVGKPKKLSEMGLSVDPIVEYQTTDGVDIFDKVDLGDPRDYLLGASGLVLKLPSRELGRAPYILPFVSTTARAGIPAGVEKDFALKVLQANYEFFDTVHDKVGVPLLLKHMDPSFVVFMHQIYGVDLNTEMSQVTVWLMDNIDSFWEITKKQGEFQEKLDSLKLPQNIIFLDINGTLFPDESKDGYIAQEDIHSLKNVINKAKEKGLTVGLCSDSPLSQLQEIAEKLWIEGPILAENGNILYYANKSLIFNALLEIKAYKEQINTLAAELGFQQGDDCIAPEFGGKPIDIQNSQWSFGANRETSVTVFGPPHLIEELGSHFKSHQQDFSVDCSPEFNYFAIHPGENYKLNKGLALNTLSVYGYNIIMVGNSLSDWVEPEHGVVCAFVNGARISSDVAKKAAFISEKPVIEGVIDILEHCVLAENNSPFMGAKILKNKGGYNNHVTIWEKQDGNKFVAKTLGNLPEVGPEIVALSPFLDKNKLQKEAMICSLLSSLGLPTQKYLYFQNDPQPQFAYEWIKGEAINFQTIHCLPELQPDKIGFNIGKFLANLHACQKGEILIRILETVPGKYEFDQPKQKHIWRFYKSIEILKEKGLIDEGETVQMGKIFSYLLPSLSDNGFKLIHGDIYSGNIFVEPETSEITGIVDWSDSTEVDDPLADLVLAARWFAFNDHLTNFTENQAVKMFNKIIDGYNLISPVKYHPDMCYKLVPFYDLLWHLKVLLAESLKDNKNNVNMLMSTLKSLLIISEKERA